MDHVQARSYVVPAFHSVFARDPTISEAQAMQGVAWLETQYGQGWRGAGVGSFNMGAIQGGKPPCNPASSFLYTDTNPTSSGASVPYQICFKKYADAVAGFRDLCVVMYQKRPSVLVAADLGDEEWRALIALADGPDSWPYPVSVALYDTTYYRGFGPTRESRIQHHYEALRAAIARIANALGERGPAMPPRTLKLTNPYTIGNDVQRVQHAIGAKEDGVFGPATEALLKDWQRANGLTPDGIFGPQSRAKATALGFTI